MMLCQQLTLSYHLGIGEDYHESKKKLASVPPLQSRILHGVHYLSVGMI
jgi:hypothetical protein